MNKNNSYLMFLTLVATLGGLLFGYDTAVISGTVKYLDLNFVAPLGLSETAASSTPGARSAMLRSTTVTVRRSNRAS